MNVLIRRVWVALLGLTLAFVGVSLVDKPALASAADCANGANGFIDIRDDLVGARAAGPVTMAGSGANTIKVRLDYGTVAGRQRGWARLYPTGNRRLLSNDRVWMDWTTNNGQSWLQCGPFYAGGLQSKTSAAKTTSSSSSYRFRACARLQGLEVSRCTGWW